MDDIENDHSISRASLDPAADAAAMLLRLGFAIFALIVPSASLLSRWVIVVLVPIGAILIILSGLLRGDPLKSLLAVAARLYTPAGIVALLLGVWALASLAWTGAPQIAAGKLFKLFGMVLLTQIAIESLPMRMRATNLHLVTIGVGIGALMILLALIGDLTGFWYLKVAALVPGRSALLLVCLGWGAAAWLIIKNRRPLAAALGAMIFLVVLLDTSREALIPMAVGLLVFSMAWAAPERVGKAIAVIFAGLIALAPLLCWLVSALNAGRMGSWWGIIQLDPLRILTGRGFDSAATGREKGYLQEDLPFSFVSDVWFDLGLVGALALAALVYFVFRALSRGGLEFAPLALAGFSSALVYGMIERSATQTWWVNGMAVFAIVLASVERGRYRTVRPRAAIAPRAMGRQDSAPPVTAQGAPLPTATSAPAFPEGQPAEGPDAPALSRP